MRGYEGRPKLGVLKRERRRRRMRHLALLGVMALGPAIVGACREERPDPELPEAPVREELTDVELGRIGGQIYNEPERAEEILAGVDLTPVVFEAHVRAVTADTARARAYTQGFASVAKLPDPADSLRGDSAQVDSIASPDSATQGMSGQG